MKRFLKDPIDSRVRQSAKDLLAKNLMPERSLARLTDIKALDAAIHSVKTDLVREWKCPSCGIVVFGPKDWMIQHSKLHAQKKEIRENETFNTHFKIY